MFSYWIRAIRIKFLLASVIAVSLGLAITWWNGVSIDLFHAVLTFVGVISLHASVDLLNDYWDFKRGIDTRTKRTKFSGGTGVLPEGLLNPKDVYKVGIGFLILGGIIGIYFVIIFGFIIGIILAFAILSVYFYSTKIVNWGLAEIFVTIKGTLIVLGTYYIQNSNISEISVYSGIVVGILSSLVLFVTSFPDYDADKEKGRKTIVIILGKQKSVYLHYIFPAIAYIIIISTVSFSIIPTACLISLLAFPLFLKSAQKLKASVSNSNSIVSSMTNTLTFSRITGVLFIIGFLIGI